MKFKISYTDGTHYEATGTPGHLVDVMKGASPFTREQSRVEYMKGYARRFHNLYGMRLPAWSPLVFLLALATTAEVSEFTWSKED